VSLAADAAAGCFFFGCRKPAAMRRSLTMPKMLEQPFAFSGKGLPFFTYSCTEPAQLADLVATGEAAASQVATRLRRSTQHAAASHHQQSEAIFALTFLAQTSSLNVLYHRTAPLTPWSNSLSTRQCQQKPQRFQRSRLFFVLVIAWSHSTTRTRISHLDIDLFAPQWYA
jgi:hypothetical protein